MGVAQQQFIKNYPKILSFQQQQATLQCLNKRIAHTVCISQGCYENGLMCLNEQCGCRDTHEKCHQISLKRVLKSINAHQQNIPQRVKESYKGVYQIIDEMVERLCQIKTNFKLQEKYYGLGKQELDFIELISPQNIGRINGNIISSLEKNLQSQVEISTIDKSQIIEDFQQKKTMFESLCLYIENHYGKGSKGFKSLNQIVKIETQNSIFSSRQLESNQKSEQSTKILKHVNQQMATFADSKILTSIQQKRLILSWLGFGNYFQDIRHINIAKLLFRASQHEFQAAKFHTYCDGKKHTLIIVKNQYNKIFGAYTSLQWYSDNDCYQDYNSFMFSITQRTMYEKKGWPHITCHQSYGPIFGDYISQNGSLFNQKRRYADLLISNRCHQNSQSFSQFPIDYTIYINKKSKLEKSKQLTAKFTGNTNGNNFKIIQYQVYQLEYKMKG